MVQQHSPSRTIWIVGASDGIGKALAQQYAQQGHKLIVSARNTQALEHLLGTMPGSSHQAVPCDIASDSSVKQAIETIKAMDLKVDCVILMAALYQPMILEQLDLAETARIVEVNMMGTFRIIHYVLPLLQAQIEQTQTEQDNLWGCKPQLALCASVAGYRGLPKSQPYAATKAGMINIAESLRAETQHWLDVRLINPGFVETRLTSKNDFHMPMKITASRAADLIIAGLQGSGFEIHFPKRFTWMVKLLNFLPNTVYFRLMR